ncbi:MULTISPECIES: hypothetical protein [Chelativorans]|uniref:Lipoprotein n=1 Tax=Chelativorans sp. (strain BNC1) TaxID=266779 RepID=Q11M23_CHESB
MRIPILVAAALAATMPFTYAENYVGGAIKSVENAGGKILTDAKDMTLYIFDKDTAGVTNCYDTCAENWPPLIAASGAAAEGEFTLVQRKDGSMQWAYKGMPLYLWKNDKKPGDVTGDGVGGVWHLAKE